MKTKAFKTLFVTLLSAAPLFHAGGAYAGSLTKAWVSGKGADAAGCGSVASPCRTFQYTHDSVIAAGGEIDVLDPADYGPISITKSVSIINDGVGDAGVQTTAAGQNAITVNTTTAPNVFLRGLTLDGAGLGNIGVSLINYGATGAGSLKIVGGSIRNFVKEGVSVTPYAGTIDVSVSGTISSGNNSGVLFQPTGSASVKATIKSVTTENNKSSGVAFVNKSSAPLTGAITDGVAFKNYWGYYVYGAGAYVTIGRSVATGNDAAGVWVQSGAAYSFGDNEIIGNSGTQVGGLVSFPIIPLR